jgi:Mce-associated membrane protein
MSPRRKIESNSDELFQPSNPEPRRWGVPLVASVAGLLVAGAIAGATVILVSSQDHERDQVRDAAVVTAVGSFMTQYTSPDPFHANDYADKVLAMGTGQFAKLYQERMTEVVIQVARSEPTTGVVQAVGIDSWNDDGSVNVVVAAKTSTKLPDGKVVEDGNRWVVTATKEGEQWKISNLLQVI